MDDIYALVVLCFVSLLHVSELLLYRVAYNGFARDSILEGLYK